MTTPTNRSVERVTTETYDGRKVVVQIGPGDVLKWKFLRTRKWVEIKVADLITQGEGGALASTAKSVTRISVDAYWKGKRIVTKIGPGDIIQHRYQGQQDWMSISINASLERAAAVKAEQDKLRKRAEKGQKFYAKRGLLTV